MNENTQKEPLNDDQRIEREKAELVAAMNRAGMPFSVHEMILVELLGCVRAEKARKLADKEDGHGNA